MAEYEMIFFMTRDTLRAVEVGANSELKTINFHGDAVFEYTDDTSIDEFYESITDTYSVNDLADLDAGICLVDCGAEEKGKWALAEKMRSCNVFNMVMLKTIFPLLLTKAGRCQAGQKTVVEFLGNKYAFICDDDCIFEEVNAKGKNVDVTLTMDDFSFLAVFDGNEFEGGSRVKALEASLAEKEKEMVELQSKIDLIRRSHQNLVEEKKQMEQEMEKKQIVIEQQKERLESMKSQNNQLQEEYKKKEDELQKLLKNPMVQMFADPHGLLNIGDGRHITRHVEFHNDKW